MANETRVAPIKYLSRDKTTPFQTSQRRVHTFADRRYRSIFGRSAVVGYATRTRVSLVFNFYYGLFARRGAYVTKSAKREKPDRSFR